MNRKIFFVLFAIGVFLVISFFLTNLDNDKQSLNTLSSFNIRSPIKIIEVRSNSIIVEGMIGSEGFQGSSSLGRKVIEFHIGGDTLFKKSVTLITKEQLNSGKPYVPKSEVISGNFDDIKANSKIFIIVGKEDLSKVSSTTALEITYLVYEYE